MHFRTHAHAHDLAIHLLLQPLIYDRYAGFTITAHLVVAVAWLPNFGGADAARLPLSQFKLLFFTFP